MRPFFRSKTEPELERQLKTTETRIGAPLSPPHTEIDLLKATLKELKERYPKRYAFYYEELKREAQEARGEGVVLGEQEARRMKNWLLALNSIDDYIFNHRTGQERTLREKQLPIFEKIREYFEQGGSQGYVKLPTGTGKTVIFSELIEAANLKTLVVVPREILLEQTQEKLTQFAPGLDTGLVYADAKEHGRQVTIITYDSFIAGLKSRLINPEDYDLLVLDEAHRSLSEARMKAVREFPHTLKIGFTATPEFSEKKKVENILPDCIVDMSIRDAVEQGMLCSFISGVIETEVDLSGVKLNEEGEYNEKMLEKAVDIEARNRGAVDVYKKLTPGEKAVVYSVGVDHAKHVAEKFVEAGIPAAAVWGDMPTKDKKDVLKKYKSGEIKVLCNADLLIEGFDDSEVRLCVNLRPTRSWVIAEQRGGRVLRLDENNPNKVAYIVDFLDHAGESGLDGAILFSEVAGQVYGRSNIPTPDEAVVADEDEEDREDASDADSGGDTDSGSWSIYNEIKNINLEGMKAVFGVKETLKMLKEKSQKEAGQSKFLSYTDFVDQAKKAGANSLNYKEIRQGHPDWPAHPDDVYDSHWKGWYVITGNIATKDREFLPFHEFIQQAKAAGVDSTNYKKVRKKYPGWPSNPAVVYEDDWVGWSVITGNLAAKDKKFLAIDDFILEAKAAGVNSQNYKEIRSSHSDWPADPDEYYKEWKGWGVITGHVASKDKKFLTYSDFVREAKEAGVKTGNFSQIRKSHPDWPSAPQVTYKGEWTGWEAITGNTATKDRKFLPFDDFIREVTEAGAYSKNYAQLRKQHKDWPMYPQKVYKGQWTGWGDIPKKKE